MISNIIQKAIHNERMRARSKRKKQFLSNFLLCPLTKILDLGSLDGTNIAFILQGIEIEPKNVFIADICEEAVKKGQKRYGYTPICIPESGRLPFDDCFFDIVYCSSTIEHVTIPKADVWKVICRREFNLRAIQSQKKFANEIIRLGKGYFVQTPYKWFPVESHTQLPFMAYIPRTLLVSFIKFSNRVWIKKTSPDWHLLTKSDMQALFPDSKIVAEKYCNLTKSIMAIKSIS